MSFRLHSTIALLVAILLLATMMPAQDASTAPQQKPPAAPQAEAPEEPTAAPVLTGPYPPMSKAAEERGRQIFQMFNTGNSGDEWTALAEGLKKRSGSEAKLAEANKRLRDRIGVENEMLEENIVPNFVAPGTIYSRKSTFSKVNGVSVVCLISINPRGDIDGFSIGPMTPVAEGRNAGHKDATKLKLPFSGEWLVTQGGRTPFDNGYATSDEVRFGVDFALLKNGSPFSGAGGIGSKNQDYYCFGQPVLAPADGTVVKAEAGYDDNVPGRPVGDQPDGNVVVISHGNSESSLINHLKQNSLKVKRGDKVKQGEEIAECGNSGSSPFPHLHYQLQRTTNELYPAQFVDYIANGKPVAVGEPKKGQLVTNGATSSDTMPAKK